MTTNFADKVRANLPAPAQRFNGFPEFNFVGGHNDADSLNVDALVEACNAVMQREGKTLATYFLESGPLGYERLRRFLVEKLRKYAGMECSVDEVMLTSGSSQAIDLINNVLLEPGDTVIVEESNYGGVLSRLNRLGVNMIAIPVDDDGMQTDRLADEMEKLAQQNIKPRYIYTIPTVHNPTGTIMSASRRQALISIAKEHDVLIFEDECYADLVWDGQRPPSLHALDDSARVVHIGSFSKTIAPALRVGYIVADWEFLKHVLAVKSDAGSGALEQMLLAEYCSTQFDSHVQTLNTNLQKKLEVLVESLHREFGTAASFDIPPGGIFLWVHLPESVDTTKLATIAAEQGVAINPGEEWSLAGDANHSLRICYANPNTETIASGVAKLAAICFDEFGIPEYGGNKRRD